MDPFSVSALVMHLWLWKASCFAGSLALVWKNHKIKEAQMSKKKPLSVQIACHNMWNPNEFPTKFSRIPHEIFTIIFCGKRCGKMDCHKDCHEIFHEILTKFPRKLFPGLNDQLTLYQTYCKSWAAPTQHIYIYICLCVMMHTVAHKRMK